MAQTSKKTRLKPLGNRVIAQHLEAEETMAGGLYLPDSAKEKQERAKIVAVGPGKKDSNGNMATPPVQEGDVVLISKYAGHEVEIDGEKLVVVNGDDIVAIVEEQS